MEGGKSGVVWASLQQHVQCWPRVAIKRRLTDAASEKASKVLSSTQLLLAQLVSGSNPSNPLEVAKQYRHELVPREHAANIASATPRPHQRPLPPPTAPPTSTPHLCIKRLTSHADTMARLCQKRDDDAEGARRLAEGSIVGRRKKESEGQKVIEARLRDDSGQVIDSSLSEGVVGLKCVLPPNTKHRIVFFVPMRQWEG